MHEWKLGCENALLEGEGDPSDHLNRTAKPWHAIAQVRNLLGFEFITPAATWQQQMKREFACVRECVSVRVREGG